MKRLNILLIIVLLASLLLAAKPVKLVRLTIRNKSGDTVYMQLEGKYTKSFYYLTVKDATSRTFTIMTDYYKRTTWACEGLKNTGSLIVTGKLRLTFVQCFTIPRARKWIDTNHNGIIDPGEIFEFINQGEPTMEKVVFFTYYTGSYLTYNCGYWAIIKVKVTIPYGCYFRYRY